MTVKNVTENNKLENIQEDYEKKVLEQSNKNEIDKRVSRADFYENQIGQDKINFAKFNAQYEDAYAKSQQIAQQGNKKLSQDYLAMRTEQIQKAEEYDKREADILANKDLSRKEKQLQLDQLNARATNEASIKFDNLADNRIASYKRANKVISEIPLAEAPQSTGTPTNTQLPVTTNTTVESGNPLLDAVTGQTNVLSTALDMVKKAITDLGPKLDNIGRNIEKVKAGALT